VEEVVEVVEVHLFLVEVEVLAEVKVLMLVLELQ
jgi:hypothetical protein